MQFYRIGDKVVSREKLLEKVEAILADRQDGATQEEASAQHGVQRSFVSFLESLGEVRRGPRVAVVGFPVANPDEITRLCERYGVEFSLVLSQPQREGFESGSAAEVFNLVLETLGKLRDFDVIVLMASDWRVRSVEHILGREVIGMTIGHSPIREDVEVDISELEDVLRSVTSDEAGKEGS